MTSKIETMSEEMKVKPENVKPYMDVLKMIMEVWDPKCESDNNIPHKEKKVLVIANPFRRVSEPGDGGDGEFYLIPTPVDPYLDPDFSLASFIDDQSLLVKYLCQYPEERAKVEEKCKEIGAGGSKYFCLRIIGREIQTWFGDSDMATTIYNDFQQNFHKGSITGVFFADDENEKDIHKAKAQAFWITRDELLERIRDAKKKDFYHFKYFPELNV